MLTHDGQPHTISIAVDMPGAILEGTVTSAANVPFAGAQVIVFPVPLQDATPLRIKVVAADHRGRFSIRGIAPGDYRVAALEQIEPGVAFSREFIEKLVGLATPVEFAKGATVTRTLTANPQN